VKKIVCSMAISLLLFILLPAPAITSPAPAQSGQENAQQALGLYEVSVFKNGQWQQVGALKYNKYLREKQIDLSRLLPAGNSARIKLTQQGGGAAHIDAVSLGGVPPVDAAGSDPGLALKKLLKRDFDVLDGYDKSIEIKFSGIKKDKILKVTARVEPEKISKTPFQFPVANLFKSINNKSHFYTYTLQSDNDASAAKSTPKSDNPFFKVLCQTDSGHPNGFTYGWVRNDDQSLYIDLDFTADNTRDGDKDYARVYVKTKAGLRAYKVSEAQTKWGTPDFTYTDKVRYQHKKYHFAIPLKELGIEKAEESKELLLAFSAYGTATPARRQKLAAGTQHTVALGADGSLWSWGSNSSGQLGDGTSTDNPNPVQENTGATDWAAVAAGTDHTAALKADGTLWAWGGNSNGQLGDGTTSARFTPIQEDSGDTDWVAVSAGIRHTVALKADGTLWAWGDNFFGQLGDGKTDDSLVPIEVGDADADTIPDNDWVSAVAGVKYTLALKADGTLWAWGNNGFGQLGDGTTIDRTAPVQEFTEATNWVAMATGSGYTVGLQADGTMWAWGNNGSGQLGDGTTDNSLVPIEAGDADGDTFQDTDWVGVDAGTNHTAALKADGTLWSWGSNAWGQLGDGANTTRINPVQEFSGATDWVVTTAGYFRTVSMKADGTLWAWGRNNVGQLGDGTTADKNTPTLIANLESLWTETSTGEFHTAALKADGTLWTWGANTAGQLGDGTTTDRLTPVQEATAATDWVAVATGTNHTVALKADGTLWAWGNNGEGRLGDGTTTDQSMPVQEATAATDWVAVDAGSYHTVALKADGTLWAWGSNYYGQLGDGSTTDRWTPVQEDSGSIDWVAMDAGHLHTVALKADGTLWAWGHNNYGQLGDGSTSDRSTPDLEATAATDWVAVTAGSYQYSYHTVALKADGTLWAWGGNYYGQLGDGSTMDRWTPVQEDSAATDWVAIDAGSYHTVALKADGTLWAWGGNYYGQLGDGSTSDRLTPVQEASAATTWISADAGHSSTAAINTEGTLWAWGSNEYGQLGYGTALHYSTPVQETTAATNWVSIGAGYYRTAGIKTDGTLWAWGHNENGDLGDGTTINRITPVQEATKTSDWTFVAMGTNQTVALRTNGTLWSWGFYIGGQPGDNQSTPVQEATAAIDWASAASGWGDTFAVKDDGTLWSLDHNANLTPVQEATAASDWMAVGVGYFLHTVALKNDGTLWAWGNNQHGQLGDGTTTNRSTPVQEATTANDWVAVDAGFYHSVALKSDGTIWAWGSNDGGQLGDGTTTDRLTPVQEATAASDWVAVSAGDYHTVALKSDGTLWAWGFNNSGQMGDGTTTNRSTPVQEATAASDWVSMAGGYRHTVALKDDGTLWAWGSNRHGEVGDGTGGYEIIPVMVDIPEDSDGDELPDSWEHAIIDYDTGDGINTIHEVGPWDDFDGDGVINQIEYENGTDPTDPGDYTAPGTGAIRGRVTDGITPIGVASVTVWANNPTTSDSGSANTDADGNYTIINLPPGCYSIRAYPSIGNHMITEDTHRALATGETEVVDFELASADHYTVTGQVILAGGSGLSNATVHYSNDHRHTSAVTITDENGDYQFDHVPPGEIEIDVSPAPGASAVTFYGTNVTLPEVASPPAYIVDDIDIPVDDACVAGEVRDENHIGVNGVRVEFESEVHNFEASATTNPNGEFLICGLPPGVGFIEAHPSGGSNYCEMNDTPVYLQENQIEEAGVITLRSCVQVNGTLNASDPDDLCGLEVRAEGDGFDEQNDTAGNTFSLNLPAGTHTIYLESYESLSDRSSVIVARPVEVTVTGLDVALGSPLQVPDEIQVVSENNPQSAYAGGTVTKTADIPNPTGLMAIMVFTSGALDNMTPESLERVRHIQHFLLPDFTGPSDSIGWSAPLGCVLCAGQRN